MTCEHGRLKRSCADCELNDQYLMTNRIEDVLVELHDCINQDNVMNPTSKRVYLSKVSYMINQIRS